MNAGEAAGEGSDSGTGSSRPCESKGSRISSMAWWSLSDKVNGASFKPLSSSVLNGIGISACFTNVSLEEKTWRYLSRMLLTQSLKPSR